MKFNHYNLGHLSSGAVAEISLQGSAANVRLMDTSNFNNYKAGRQHRYYGGLAQASPVRLTVPRAGTWHVTVDMQGLQGTTRSSLRVIPAAARQPLPAINDAPLAAAPMLVRSPRSHDRREDSPRQFYDVFISHASEDKPAVVLPLAMALREAGLTVWFDDFELQIGDSLRHRIDQGLSSSLFGVVILSPSFFGRSWPEYELDGLVVRAVSGDQVLLPIWHNLTKQEVIDYSPSLADRLARTTATHTIEEIAAEIVEVIQNAV